jgi:uncharacterized membrane-anchored protein
MFDGIWTPGQTSDTGKVPEVTLLFWVIKIAATTLGETGGDALSMSFHFGYALSTGIFVVLFLAAVVAQCRARSFHPALYWTVIVATTTAGTTMADFADRSLGYGYAGGSLLLAGLQHHHHQGRVILLGGDPVLEHAGHRLGRLRSRFRAWRRRPRL